jgi:hypothetical protein
MTAVARTEEWSVGAADDPDPRRAVVFRLDDGSGRSRLLDRTSKVLFPAVPTQDLVGRQRWYPPDPEISLDLLLEDVSRHDDVDALRQSQRKPARTSLGRPRARIRQWEPEQEIVLSRSKHVFSPEQLSTWGALLTTLRRAKGRVEVAAYIDADPGTAYWLPKWLRAPAPPQSHPDRPPSPIDTTQHPALDEHIFEHRWLLGAGDRLRLFPLDRPDHGRWHNRLEDEWAQRPGVQFTVGVANRDHRPDRYFESVGFADVVVFAADMSRRQYPMDLWTKRSNALIIPARSEHAEDLLTRLDNTARSAIFLADPSSTRVWQHLTGMPDVARLETCLLRLVEHLGRYHDEGEIEAQVRTFLRSVCVGGLGDPGRARLEDFIASHALLSRFELDLG